MKLTGYAVLLTFVFVSCTHKSIDEEISEAEIIFKQPINFPKPTYNLIDNPITKEGVVLGRKLFYDNRLSSDNSINCGSCHNQTQAFTDHGKALSNGFLNRTGVRNAPPLQNLAFLKSFNWDGSANQLWKQPVVPITSEVEMNESITNVLTKLRKDAVYVTNFKKVFNIENALNSINLLKALAKFMATMVSSNSKYDKYARGEAGGFLTNQEKEGLDLFQQKCATCHSGELFTSQEYANNGIGENLNFPKEMGAANVVSDNIDLTIEEARLRTDYYQFTIPSLRNIAKTAPYMHDGRMESLKKVLDFYDTDTPPYVVKMNQLDKRLINNKEEKEVLGIPMKEVEKEAIIVFLQTLTDYEFLNNQRFEQP